MKEYQTIKLKLKPEQMRALAGGRVVSLKSEMVGSGVSVTIGPVQHKKLMKALKANKGYRLRLNEDEKKHTMTHGGALKDYFTKKRVRKIVDTGVKVAKPFVKTAIKNAVTPYVDNENKADLVADVGTKLAEEGIKAVGKRTAAFGLKAKAKPKKGGDIKSVGRKIKRGFQKAVDTYKKDIRPVAGPIIREGLTKAIQIGAPALVTSLGAPELAPVAGVLANQYARKGVDYLGDSTGAFGVYGRGVGDYDDDFDLRPKSFTVEANRSQFLSKHHPAMRPLLPMPDFSRPRHQEDRHGDRFIENHYKRNHSLVNYFVDHYHPPLNRIYGRGAEKGSPLNPRLPPKDNTLRELYYDDIRRGGSFSMGGSFRPN